MSNTSNEHEIVAYIKAHPAAVLGTVDEHNSPQGAAVFICPLSAERLYFVTKTETQKFKDIIHNPQVSLTIVDTSDNSSLQAVGRARIENKPEVIDMIMEKMTKIYVKSADWLPPISKLHAGAYQVIEISVHHARLAHFKDKHAGSEYIFKQI